MAERGARHRSRNMSGTVETVLGPVEVSQLKGAILPHEHILLDFTRGLVPPPPGLEWLPDTPLCLEHLGKIRQYPYSVRQNLLMNRVEEMEQELSFFKQAGGGTICELSVTGIRCHPHRPELLAELARKTGVNIIHATGFYCHQFLPSDVHSMSVQEMRDFMLREIQVGVGQSNIRCGVIYIGCSWPLHNTEQKALKAAAAVQKETGTPITIHPGRTEESPFQILDILQSEGADVSRVCIPHLCRTFSSHSKFLELAARECYINISLFGKECSHNQYATHLDVPSDAQRLGMVKVLLQSGYKDKILMSQDVVCKHELRCYGGDGYAHLLEHIKPKMEERGVSKNTINTIFSENPKQWLIPIPTGKQ